MRIPTNEEYNMLVETTCGEESKMYWDQMYSWVNDTKAEYKLSMLSRADRGYFSASNWDFDSASSRLVYVGFRPAFEPLEVETLAPQGDLSIIGTLYMDGLPVEVPQKADKSENIVKYIPGAKLEVRPSLGDPAYIITGFRVGNAVISDRVILNQISYEEIEKAIKTKGRYCENPN